MSNKTIHTMLNAQKVGLAYNVEKLTHARCEHDERDDVICGQCGETPEDCNCYDSADATTYEESKLISGFHSN